MWLFRAYLVERVRPAVFLPALAGLWLAVAWASGEPPGLRPALPLLLLALALVQFRLWDDLEDIEHDRRVHPDRLLARSALGPFRTLLAALTTVTLAVAALAGPAALVSLAAIDVFFLAAYRLVRPLVPDVVWRFPLLLAKYPAFVLLAAVAAGVPAGGRLAIAMLAALAGACAFEALHDRRRPTGAHS